MRGNTSRKIIRMIKEAGAKEVHLRISSPPFKFPCYFGIDTPSRAELIASSHSPQQIKQFLGCDSLGYLSVEGMIKVIERTGIYNDEPEKLARLNPKRLTGKDFCFACFTGQYPVSPDDSEFIVQLRLFR